MTRQPGTLTAAEGEELVAHIYLGDVDAVADLLAERDVSPHFLLGFLADFCGGLLPRVVGTDLERPGDMWALQQVRPGAVAPPWLQLVTAAANRDEQMVRAHLGAICTSDRAVKDATVGLMGMTRTLLTIIASQNGGDR